MFTLILLIVVKECCCGSVYYDEVWVSAGSEDYILLMPVPMNYSSHKCYINSIHLMKTNSNILLSI